MDAEEFSEKFPSPPLTIEKCFSLTELKKLQEAGFKEASDVSSAVLFMDSEYIHLWNNPPKENTGAIISLKDPTTTTVFDNFPDRGSVLLHPDDPFVMATKVQRPSFTKLSLVNHDPEIKREDMIFNRCEIPGKVVFWKWTFSYVLTIVTEDYGFHWLVDSDLDPVKFFHGDTLLLNKNIVDYDVCDGDMEWFVLVGQDMFGDDDIGVEGVVLVCSNNKHFCYEGSAICVIEPGLLAIVNSNEFYVLQLTSATEGQIWEQKIKFPLPLEHYGIPMGMHLCDKYGLIFVIRRRGVVFVFDSKTFFRLASTYICEVGEYIRLSSKLLYGGFYAIDKKGLVLRVIVNDESIVGLVREKNPDVAMALATRANLSGMEDKIDEKFKMLCDLGDFILAAEYAALSPQDRLRTSSTINILKGAPTGTDQQAPLSKYLEILLKKGTKLNSVESIEFTRIALEKDSMEELKYYISKGRLNCNELIGDLINDKDPELALQVFQQGNVRSRIVGGFVDRKQYQKILMYFKKVGAASDEYLSVLRTILDSCHKEALKFASMLSQIQGGSPIEPTIVADLFDKRKELKASKDEIKIEEEQGHDYSEDDITKRVHARKKCVIKIVGSQPKLGCKFMYERIEDKFEFLQSRMTKYEHTLVESGLFGVPMDPTVASQKSLLAVGMICCEEGGRLKEKPILLQSSVEHSGGQRIRLDLQKLEQFSIFPGQVIGVVGHNPSGHCFIASRIIDRVPLSDSSNETLHPSKKLALDQNVQLIDPSDTAAELSCIIAAGPYTINDNLMFEPLVELLGYAKRKQPQLLILQGPFIDSDHPEIKKGSFNKSCDEMFQLEILGRLQDYLDRMGSSANVLLVPSIRDAHHDFVFPQPRFDLNLSNLECQMHSISNPGTFTANEVKFACCSVDILKHLSAEEISRNPQGDSEQHLATLSNHVLNQKSFYPLYPPAESVPLDLTLAPEALQISSIPDILVLPSDLAHFVQVLSLAPKSEGEQEVKCLCVNPGRLASSGVGFFVEMSYNGSPDSATVSFRSI